MFNFNLSVLKTAWSISLMQNELFYLSFSHSKKKRLLHVFVTGFVLIVDAYFRIIVLTFIFIDIDLMANHDYNLHQVVEGFRKINK